jgi:hypothetical protein
LHPATVEPPVAEPPAVEPAEPPVACVPPAVATPPPIPPALVVPPVLVVPPEALVPPVAVPPCVAPPELTPPVAFVPPVLVPPVLVPPVDGVVFVCPPVPAPPLPTEPPTADEPPPPEAKLLVAPPVLGSTVVDDVPPLEFGVPPTPGLTALGPSLVELEHAGSATTTAAQRRIDLFIFINPWVSVANRFPVAPPLIAHEGQNCRGTGKVWPSRILARSPGGSSSTLGFWLTTKEIPSIVTPS